MNVNDIKPITTAEGTALSRVQYARFTDVLSTLSADEWTTPTADCPGWSVKDIAGHVLGNLECVMSPREFVRQVIEGRKLDRKNPYEGLNAYQVKHYAALTPAEVLSRISGITERALRRREKTPWVLRTLIRPKLDVVGRMPMSYVLDVIYTRDTYLHRVDICRATDRDVVLDETERRIIADLVAEWARQHGKPFRLTLTGPAGDTYESGTGGDEITCDAVEFTRLVSGRGTGEGLLATRAQY